MMAPDYNLANLPSSEQARESSAIEVAAATKVDARTMREDLKFIVTVLYKALGDDGLCVVLLGI